MIKEKKSDQYNGIKKSSILEPGISGLSDLNSVSFQTAYWLRLGHANEYHALLIWK